MTTLLEKYKDEEWMKLIDWCQNEISAIDSNSYYATHYKKQEKLYWLHIPEWLYEDSNRINVSGCLDIGCAYGTLALFCHKLFNCPIYCIDNKGNYMNTPLLERYNFNFSVNDIELDPFPWDTKFDVIILTEVLEHFNFYPVPTLTKISKLMSEKGRLYLSTPDAAEWKKNTKYYKDLKNIPLPQKGLPIVDDHIYHYNVEELLKITNEAGLTVERLDYAPGASQRHFNLTLKRKEAL